MVRQALFLALLTSLVLTVSAQAAAADDSEASFLGFDVENGMRISEPTVISGSLVSSLEPTAESSWSLVDQTTSENLVIGGGVMSFGEPVDYGNLLKWNWEISIETSLVGDCSCVLQATVSHGDGISVSSSLATFIGNSSGAILLPNEPVGESWAKSEIAFSGWSDSNSSSVIMTFSVLSSDSLADTCQGSTDPSSDFPHSISSSGQYYSIIDVSEFDDGWYSAWTTTTMETESLTNCVSIKIDNSPPVSIISGASDAQEGDSAILFDGGSSDDGFWGKGDLFCIWTVLDKSRPGSAPIAITQGESTFSMDTHYSGEFEIILRVVDASGLHSTTSRTINIANVVPTVKLVVDGKSATHGDSVRLSSGSSWDIDASESMDTTNDINGLRCVWKIDNSPVYEGCERTFSWPENESQKLILTVEVIDDNDDYAFISVELVHPDYSDDLPLGLVVLVVSAAFLASAILFRRNSSSGGDIPKWQPDEQN